MPKSKYKKKKEMYMSGGSIMVPPEREKYGLGSGVSKIKRVIDAGMAKVNKRLDKLSGVDEDSAGRTAADRGAVIGKDRTKAFENTAQIKGGAVGATVVGTGAAFNSKDLPKKDRTAFEKKFRKARNEGKKTFMFQGTEYNTNLREEKAEGGSLMMPPEMAMDMPVEEESIEEPVMDVPEDTYPNATPEELENAQEPDEVVEQDQMEMVLNQALDTEEQQYLMNALEGDEQLSQIFDKVLTTASEFSGSGEVDGLGDGLSDSIPARLSDGEFVITKKATDQIGADNLQTMMDDAERAYDGGMMRKDLYGGGLLPSASTDSLESNTRNTDDEIRKLMSLRANQAPSLR